MTSVCFQYWTRVELLRLSIPPSRAQAIFPLFFLCHPGLTEAGGDCVVVAACGLCKGRGALRSCLCPRGISRPQGFGKFRAFGSCLGIGVLGFAVQAKLA